MNYKNLQVGEKEKEPGADLGFSRVGSFSFSPTSHELQYIVVTRGFTRLNMKTKYVCRALISLYVNFHNNRTMWSINLHVKICRWGGKEKRALESRGGRIFKNCRKFCRPFFIFFLSSAKALFYPYFGQIFCAAGKILKRQAKKGVFGHFLENSDQKIAFFRRALPLTKLVYIDARGAFTNFLGSITKNGYLKIVHRGSLWVGRGSNPWGGGGVAGRLAPFDFLLICLFSKIIDSFSSANPLPPPPPHISINFIFMM